MPNKATRDVREAIAAFATANVERIQGWIESVGAVDPARALDLYLRALEYHIPKIQRSELTGKDGGPVVIQASAHDERL